MLFVRLAANYLPNALWFHLALGLIFIDLHKAWQPLVTSHRLFVIMLQHGAFKKTEVCFELREGTQGWNSCSRNRIPVIPGENFGGKESDICGERLLEWNSEMKARSPRRTSHTGPNYQWRRRCFPQPNRLALNEALARWLQNLLIRPRSTW